MGPLLGKQNIQAKESTFRTSQCHDGDEVLKLL